MKIGIIGSMQFSQQMINIAEELRKLGHEPILSLFVQSFIGKNAEEQERIKIEQKNQQNAMKRDIENLKSADAILMLNLDKNGISNYIGGNAFLEMGMAYVDDKKIFLYNPIPDILVFKTEIEAMKPVVLNGDLTLLQKNNE